MDNDVIKDWQLLYDILIHKLGVMPCDVQTVH